MPNFYFPPPLGRYAECRYSQPSVLGSSPLVNIMNGARDLIREVCKMLFWSH